MANRDIVAIGTSAGGVEALLFLCRHLPADLPASILVTLHLPSNSASALDVILSKAGPLPAKFASDGDVLKQGQIFLSPPSRHLLLEDDHIVLGRGPRENNARPAIDPMLRSVAVCCGGRAVGVVLTGTLGDGASGLWAISRCGGISIVQDPSDAAFPEMPLTALNRAMPHHIVRLAELPSLLNKLVHQPAGESMPAPESIKFEVRVARDGISDMEKMDQIGHRSVFTCPECNGSLWEIQDGDLVHYRCHVGHAFSADRMSSSLDDSLRRALATALRTLDERVALAESLRKKASERGHNQVTAHWAEKKDEFDREASIIRRAIRQTDDLAAEARANSREATGTK